MSRAIALAQSSCFSTLRQTSIRQGAVGLILRTRTQSLGQPRSPHAPHAQHAPRARAYSQLFLRPQTAPRTARRRLLTTTPTSAAPAASTARPAGSENSPTRHSSSSSDSGSTTTTTTTTSEGTCKSSPSLGTSAADMAIRAAPKPYLTRAFWSCKHTWRRAMVNTFRCLVGCSIGDLGTMYYLMAYYPDVDMGTSMALSMTAGITTSILLETTLLHLGKDRLEWGAAAKMAMGMSLVSMLAMEFTENLVTLGLSDASTTITSPNFWAITGLSMAAGFVAPLPYNYVRLKLWGKACH